MSWSDRRPGRLQAPGAGGGGVATLGKRSFTYSGRSGDLGEVHPGGFFHEDIRFASRLELRVNGVRPEPLDAGVVDRSEALFLLRHVIACPDRDSDQALLVRRRRRQLDRLEEELVLENRTLDPLDVDVELEVAADFVTVTELILGGQAGAVPPNWSPIDGGLRIEGERDGLRVSTTVTCEGGAARAGGTVGVRRTLSPGESWRLPVTVVGEIRGNAPPPPARSGLEAEPRPGRRSPRLSSSLDAVSHLWEQSLFDLEALELVVDGRPTYAAGVPWFMRLFGRDSVITAIETLLVAPERALATVEALAALQGRAVDKRTGEERGKIPHEVQFVRGRMSLDNGACFYESVDATPLFCILLGKLPAWGAPAEGVAALLPALRAAVGWVEAALDAGDGLLFYDRGPRLVHQGWKDTLQPIVDAAGSPLGPPLAVVEAQAYAVAALRSAAELEGQLGDSSRVASLLALADELVEQIDRRFWREQLGTYALAVGADGQLADTAASNAGHVLWAGAAREERIAAVAASLLSEELWSGWGIRTLTRRNPAYNPASYHLGGVWPHDTMMCAAALFACGRAAEARSIVGGLLAAAQHLDHQLPELFCGFDRSAVPYPVRYPGSSAPQAWAAGAGVYLVQQLLGIEPALDRGFVAVSPRLPEGARIELSGIPLGGGRLSLAAEGAGIEIVDAPPGITIVTPGTMTQAYGGR